MARRRNKSHGKTFQQRQTERAQADEQDRSVVDDMVTKYVCSNGIAHDFAGQCDERITDLDFDLLCSDMALEFWASPPSDAQAVVDLLRELADERRRHQAALRSLHARLFATTQTAAHAHLNLPADHYRGLVRDRLFPGLELRPVQNRAVSGER